MQLLRSFATSAILLLLSGGMAQADLKATFFGVTTGGWTATQGTLTPDPDLYQVDAGQVGVDAENTPQSGRLAHLEDADERVQRRDPESSQGNRIVNLYDAFGEEIEGTRLDWGFSALVEYRGQTILFDGGNSPEIISQNARALGIDLTRVDIAILSHRHPDHASGLDYLTRVNPEVTLFLPNDTALGGPEPFELRAVPDDVMQSLPAKQRYFRKATTTIDYDPGDRFWGAHTEFVVSSREIAPGVNLIVTKSQQFRIHELSLALETDDGTVLVTGCSHSGLPTILRETLEQIEEHVALVVGGYHLAWKPIEQISELARALKTEFQVTRVAPAHCSGHTAFKVFQDVFSEKFVFFGLGSEIELPD